jgi:hypothetical protein
VNDALWEIFAESNFITLHFHRVKIHQKIGEKMAGFVQNITEVDVI